MRVALHFAGCLVCAVVLPGCGIQHPDRSAGMTAMHIDSQSLARLHTKRIFFGHKSVGDNIVTGLRELMRDDRRLKLNIVNSSSPESVVGPALIERHVGTNRDPQSKNRDFTAALASGFGEQGGIAILKYCYADIDVSTNVEQMFAEYQDRIGAARQRYPRLRIVHVTVPLTVNEPAAKAWLKSLLGKRTARAANVRRHRYNELLRHAYAGVEPIFDLADVESTRSDGSKHYFRHGNSRIESLVAEYSADGGHLNEIGRRAAAVRLLGVLAVL